MVSFINTIADVLGSLGGLVEMLCHMYSILTMLIQMIVVDSWEYVLIGCITIRLFKSILDMKSKAVG